MNNRLYELDKLEKYLKAKEIHYERIDLDGETNEEGMIIKLERLQICVGENIDLDEGIWEWDVICHWGSHGYKDGLLEGMGIIYIRRRDSRLAYSR